MIKKISAAGIVLVVGIVIGFAVAVQWFGEGTEGTVYDTEMFAQEITEISELSTLQSHYSAEMPYKGEVQGMFKKPESFLNQYGIHLFDKNMEIKFEGTVKFGVNMENFTKDDISIDEDNQTVTVTIPKSEILSHEIDEDSWEIIDKKNGLFNALTPSDDAAAHKQAKKIALEKINVDKQLSKADAKAQQQITNFLQIACPDMEVEVVTE